MNSDVTEEPRVLAGRYRLLERLGEGGMGSVWLAEHVELGSHIAIKLIDEELALSASALSRFKLEAKAAAALSSTHVVRVFDYGVDGSTPFIAMELLQGESLDERLEREGHLSPEKTGRVLTHVARALDQAHSLGMVHRDIKPGNIFISRGEDGEDLIKVLDFGIAKSLRPEDGAHSHTRTGMLVGSPSYMSPEQMRASKDIDQTADLWSLGVVAYECLVGERPFEGESMVELTVSVCMNPLPVPSERGPVPPGFDEWFARACSRERSERFQDAKEFAGAFEELAADYDPVLPADSSEGPGRARGRSPTSASQSGVAMVRSTTALEPSEPVVPAARPNAGRARRLLVLVAVGVGAIAAVAWLLLRGSSSATDTPAAAESAFPVVAASVQEPVVSPVLPPSPDRSRVAKGSGGDAGETEPPANRAGAARDKTPRVQPAPQPVRTATPGVGKPVAAPAPAEPEPTPEPIPAEPPDRDYGF